MKKSISLVFVLCLLFSLAIPAFAADDVYTVSEETEIIEDGTSVYVDNNVTITQGRDLLTGVSTYSAREITAAETTGLKSAMLSVLGSYDAIVVEYEYTNDGDNAITYERTVQPDYVWIASAVLLICFIVCLFKMGVAICKR